MLAPPEAVVMPAVPVAATGPDDVAAALRELRTWAGNPSYAQLTRSVSRVRGNRGLPASEARIGRSTVYDCFRDGRARLDHELVTDIVTALGASPATRVAWRQALRRAASPGRRLSVAEVQTGVPDQAPVLGRTTQVEALSDPVRDVVVHGMAGVGKTTLAHHLARLHLRAGRVEEVLRVNLRGVAHEAEPVDPDAVVEAVLRVLGERPTGRPADQYARLLGERRLLFVLDNAGDEDQILPLLPRRGARSHVIVTSRRALRLPGLEAVALEELDEAAARDLLALASGRGRAAGDEAALNTLGARCGRLPLALDLVGRQVARTPGWTWEDHVAALDRQLRRLDLDEDVTSAVALSYANLTAADQRVFRRLCCHPGPEIGTEAAQVLVDDADPAATRAALDRLVAVSLLRSRTPGRWAVHDLVRAFGRRRAESEEAPSRLAAALGGLLEHYVTRAAASVADLVPMAKADWAWLGDQELPEPEEDAASWLARERVNLLGAAEWAATNGHERQAVRLAVVLSHYLFQQGDLDLTLALHRTGRAAAVSTDDVWGQSLTERNIGNTLIRMTRYDAARSHLEHAARLSEQTGDVIGRQSALNSLAMVASATGDQESAIAVFTEMLHSAEGQQPTERMAAVRANLAVSLFRAGQRAEGTRILEELALESAEHGWRERERWSWINAMPGMWVQGRAEDAVTAGERALVSAREDDDLVAVGYAQANLVSALRVAGHLYRAHRMARDARRTALRADAQELQASVASHLGELLLTQDRLDEARDAFAEALGIAEPLAEADEIRTATDGLARVEAARAGVPGGRS